WEAGDDFGFSDVPAWADPGAAVIGLSVEEQRLDPDSLWWHYRRMISLRRIHPALYAGTTTMIDVGDRAVLAMLREAGGEAGREAGREAGGERLLVVANLAARDAAVDLVAVGGLGDDGAVDIITGAAVSAEGDFVVPALGLRVLRLP
ncbi:MAG TPA: DUF3459 domain-containing protein, partial [Trueperaceae bacterium]|nr:DUF3459 domain-containing protein [Trueperaceae bacterium]